MDNEHGGHGRHEIVKCVVVGDTAVGKTRLICARACNSYLTFSQLLSTHVPTVWAIDQYRIHKEVLQKSWRVVDGVHVSLRLWDTFGDHEKDRKFAYGRSDVVLLCFSVSNQLSLRNCKAKWFPEIRSYCPHTPIVLVGCKNDLRHIHRDKNFLNLCKERSPFIRIPQESDLTTPDQGRNVADEIGAPYYEASVLTQYGIDDVFENAIRLALLARKQQRFWAQNLKNVLHPFLQMPYCPPCPSVPEIYIGESTYTKDLLTLLDKGYYADVKFYASKTYFVAHSFVLMSVSPYFRQLLAVQRENNSWRHITAFRSMKPHTIYSYLKFLYTGKLDVDHHSLYEILLLAKFTSFDDLEICIENVMNTDDFMNNDVQKKYINKLQGCLKNTYVNSKYHTDVVFKLDDGNCLVHRAMLMARSDVMQAMFNGQFVESKEKVVSFPGVSKRIFQKMVMYLYMDKLDKFRSISDHLPLVELANRLCLSHLTSLIENQIVTELSEMNKQGTDISEHICHLLEPCQVHNAVQLAEWCQYFIATNYNEISNKSQKLIRMLHPENQAYLNKNRWPPASYLREVEYYERSVHERSVTEKAPRLAKWRKASEKVHGYFWLCGGNNITKGSSQSPVS